MKETRELLRKELELLLNDTNSVAQTVEEIIAHIRFRENNLQK